MVNQRIQYYNEAKQLGFPKSHYKLHGKSTVPALRKFIITNKVENIKKQHTITQKNKTKINKMETKVKKIKLVESGKKKFADKISKFVGSLEVEYLVTIHWQYIYKASDTIGRTIKTDNIIVRTPIVGHEQNVEKEVNRWLDSKYDNFCDAELVHYTYKKAKGVTQSKHFKDFKMFGVFDDIYKFDTFDLELKNDFDTHKNCCVFDLLKYMYGDIRGVKKLFRKNIDQLKKVLNIEELDEGISTNQLLNFCKEFGINMRALDIDFDLIADYHPEKRGVKGAPPLIYVYYENHGYLIKDEEKLKEIKDKFNLSRMKKDNLPAYVKSIVAQHKERDMKRMNEDDVLFNVSYDEIDKLRNKVIVFDKLIDGETKLSCQEYYMKKLIKDYVIIKTSKWKNFKCIELKDKNGNIMIDFDNFLTTKFMFHQFGMPFNGGTMNSLVKNIFENFDKKNGNLREVIENDVRRKVFEKCEGICIQCGESDNLEIDHKIPVSKGGTNDVDNLQLLCKTCNLKKGNYYFKWNDLLSAYNPDTKLIFNEWVYNKHRPINVNLNKEENITAHKLDIAKDYTACMTNKNVAPWMVLEATDEFVDFDGEIKDGFYIIDSIIYANDTLKVLFGNDKCFTGFTLKYLINIGCYIKISKQLIPRKKLDPHYFVPFVDFIVDKVQSDIKHLINPFIGMLGQKHFDSVNIHKVCKREECLGFAYKYMDFGQNRKIVQIDGAKDLYHFFCYQDTQLSENARPIRQQILENSSILMYELIRKSGIKFKDIKKIETDAIYYKGSLSKLKIDIPKKKTEKENNFLKENVGTSCLDVEKFGYLRLEKKNVLVEYFKEKEPEEIVDNLVLTGKTWNEKILCDAPDAETAKEYIKKNSSFCIQAMAGCGKTYFVREEVCEILDEMGLKYKKIAPTNKAARKIGGETIHSAVNINKKREICINKNGKTYNEYKSLDYLIVDEISMVSYDLWMVLKYLKDTFRNLKLILIGHFAQIPPVECDVRDYENSILLKELSDWNLLTLTKCMRSDDSVFKLQNDVLFGDGIDIKEFPCDENMKNICYTNFTRRKINTKCMKKFMETYEGPTMKYMDYKVYENGYHQNNFVACEGMKVVCISNMYDHKIYNSEEYKITKIDGGFITIEDEDRVFVLEPELFFEKFVMAFCVTCYKAQGDDFNEPYTIHDWDKMTINMKYVAISRATKFEYINFG